MTTNALEHWQALSRRIQGLVTAGRLCKPNDSYSTLQKLREHAKKIVKDLETFKERYKLSLSPSAVCAIDFCTSKRVDISAAKLLHEKGGIPSLRDDQVWSALVMLAAFETEMTFIMSDVIAVAPTAPSRHRGTQAR